jgi:hypothetical protein
MTTLVQLSLRKVTDPRVERGVQPVFQMDLEDHERIVGVEHYFTTDYHDRKTVDHHASVWVEVRLG